MRNSSELEKCDALIIPGGRIHNNDASHQIWRDAQILRRIWKEKKPVFGTCAGLILMSQAVKGDPMEPLGFFDVEIERNAYGRQADSFCKEIDLHLNASRSNPTMHVHSRPPYTKNQF